MPTRFANLIRQTTTTTGTGTLTLGPAANGFLALGAEHDGLTFGYTIETQNGLQREIGTGVYTHAGATFTRAAVESSTNDGELLDLPAGTHIFRVDLPASVVDGIAGPIQQQLDRKNEGLKYHTFAFGDAAQTIVTVPAGKMLIAVLLSITEAFDGTGAAIELGISGDVDAVMDASENAPAQVGAYEITPQIVWGTATNVILTITPGSGASTGAGVVAIQLQE